MKFTGNLCSQERKFPGTFAPGSESSHWELSFKERKYRGAKSPDTIQISRAGAVHRPTGAVPD